MSYYTDRWVLFKEEGTFGTYATPNTFMNYMLAWDVTTSENLIEEELIAGARDWKSRAWTEEEIAGRFEFQPVSAKMFYFVLGSFSNTVGTAHTMKPHSTIPSLSFYRGLYPDASSNTVSIGYYGVKIDTAEIRLEVGEDVTMDSASSAEVRFLGSANLAIFNLISSNLAIFSGELITR